MTVSNEAVGAALNGYHYTARDDDRWAQKSVDAMRRAIEAADRVRGGVPTLPMMPSDEAAQAALIRWEKNPWASYDNFRLVVAAAYAIDGVRDPRPVMETVTLRNGPEKRVPFPTTITEAMPHDPSSALRALLHSFRNVTGNFGWCLVRRAELDAAMAELDALERK